MTTKVFKVGDRIALYNCGLRFVGTIKKFTDKGNIIVNGDGVGVSWHPKQCRRLKPRRRPSRIWVLDNDLDACESMISSSVEATICKTKMCGDCTEFVEVIHAQKKEDL